MREMHTLFTFTTRIYNFIEHDMPFIQFAMKSQRWAGTETATETEAETINKQPAETMKRTINNVYFILCCLVLLLLSLMALSWVQNGDKAVISYSYKLLYI